MTNLKLLKTITKAMEEVHSINRMIIIVVEEEEEETMYSIEGEVTMEEVEDITIIMDPEEINIKMESINTIEVEEVEAMKAIEVEAMEAIEVEAMEAIEVEVEEEADIAKIIINKIRNIDQKIKILEFKNKKTILTGEIVLRKRKCKSRSKLKMQISKS